MQHRRHALAVAAALALSTTPIAAPFAHAFDIETPDPELKVRLDLTPKYSLGYRLKNPSPALTQLDVTIDPGTVNEDDGDHNFKKGVISNRFDLLAELDVSAKNFGGRISGSAWRDSVRPKNSGRGGVQLRWSPTGSDSEFGFYAAQYHDKTPEVPVFDFAGGNVHLAYAENIRTFGASVTSSAGQLNWALEGSLRTNAPLTSDPAPQPANTRMAFHINP